MQKLLLKTLASLLLFSTSSYMVQAGDFKNGETLHDGNCMSCHTTIMNGKPNDIYTREDRRIESYEGLTNQVNRCESNLGIVWPENQVDDVVTFLNQSFYKFKK